MRWAMGDGEYLTGVVVVVVVVTDSVQALGLGVVKGPSGRVSGRAGGNPWDVMVMKGREWASLGVDEMVGEEKKQDERDGWWRGGGCWNVVYV